MTAQVVAITETKGNKGALEVIKWAWTTDSVNGAVVAATAAGAINKTTFKYTGMLVKLVTVPTDGPTDNYDLTIIDSNSVDVLCGSGTDRDTTAPEYVSSSSLGFVLDSQLSLLIASAGNSKSGVVYLYIASM
jgi:hypothetical protein